MVQDMIKTIVISKEIGKSSGWIYWRQCHYEIKGKIYHFTQEDVDSINNAMDTIANRLKGMMITYSKDREEVIRQVKALSEIVKAAFIYDTKFGKNKSWWINRIRKVSKNGLCSSFSEEDILNINIVAMEIISKLSGIEFIL